VHLSETLAGDHWALLVKPVYFFLCFRRPSNTLRALLRTLGHEARKSAADQYSDGSSSVVELRSASVMIQSRSPVESL
jgi:hypothetical protein